jgi:hypothetical protein
MAARPEPLPVQKVVSGCFDNTPCCDEDATERPNIIGDENGYSIRVSSFFLESDCHQVLNQEFVTSSGIA